MNDFAHKDFIVTVPTDTVSFEWPLCSLQWTHGTFIVFRYGVFLPTPFSHQSTTPVMLCVAILRVFKAYKMKHLTDGKLFPQSLNCVSKLRFMTWVTKEPDIQRYHRLKLKGTKPVVYHPGKSQSQKIQNQVTTLVALRPFKSNPSCFHDSFSAT